MNDKAKELEHLNGAANVAWLVSTPEEQEQTEPVLILRQSKD